MESLFGFETLVRRGIVDHTGTPLALTGLTPPAKGIATATLALRLGRPLVLVADKANRAEELYETVRFFHGPGQGELFFFPPWEILPYEELSPHPEVTGQRLSTLARLLNHPDRYILVTSVEALARKVAPPDAVARGRLTLDRGDDIDLELLADHLVSFGYRRVDLVEERGEFSIRGGIVDIFTGDDDRPVRVELFGDEIESIRRYNPDTQRSVEQVETVTLYPYREVFYEGVDRERLMASFDRMRIATGAPLSKHALIREEMTRGGFFAGMERLLPLFFEEPASLFDYLPHDPLLVVDEPELCAAHLETFYELVEAEWEEARNRHDMAPPPEGLFLSKEEIEKRLDDAPLRMTEWGGDGDDRSHRIGSSPPTRYKGRFDDFLTDLRKRRDEGYATVVVAASEGSAGRLEKMMNGEDEYPPRIDAEGIGRLLHSLVEPQPALPMEDPIPPVALTVGHLPEGVILTDDRVMVVTDDEIFGRVRKVKRRNRPGHKAFAVGVADLTPGDLVVHATHGVGRYIGARSMTIGDATDEYLDLEYADNQKLLLPIANIHLVKKYISAGAGHPALDRMGGAAWKKTKARVKKGVMEMAERLLKLAAARQLAQGHAFTEENNFHREFADSFEYEETGDQLSSISEIAADMEQIRPMDRLVCGDVGYGKTEVAMRAAFKAVYDGKQVAVLCPTTLLAQQHYQTFLNRFASFPVSVEVLSRFKTAKETREIVAKLALGEIDILVGTHKILGKDVKFRDLGLVIIDEEQRFGVKHKERLRSLAQTVDSLTLTATPIPRTLHTAMLGIRELSVIETPPVDRQAVRNAVVKFGDKVIREAIVREMDRGGQVFFVHNKVRSLQQMASYVTRLVPQARVVAAHGQMAEGELEEIMVDFVARRHDVLVTTTIIESGLDIPNANTMIINRADHFGLAQLYQLRGRVGRDRRRAYCYFLIPGMAGVTDVARKRLKAIEELSELGSGFRLAARDMEIRGAGNLLGPEQSGNIDAVGFDTYTEMLEDAVRELKGEPMDDRFEVDMKLAIQGKIAPDYVPGLNQRLELYNRLHACRTVDELKELTTEMRDRFGPVPEETEKLVTGLTIKVTCRHLKVERVDMIRDRLILSFNSGTRLDPERMVTAAYQRGIKLRFTGPATVEAPVTGEGWRGRYGFIRDFLALLGGEGI